MLHEPQKLIGEHFPGQNDESVIVGSWAAFLSRHGPDRGHLTTRLCRRSIYSNVPLFFPSKTRGLVGGNNALWWGLDKRGTKFCFRFCAPARVTAAEKESLDLRSWSVAFNGAEPILAETLDKV